MKHPQGLSSGTEDRLSALTGRSDLVMHDGNFINKREEATGLAVGHAMTHDHSTWQLRRLMWRNLLPPCIAVMGEEANDWFMQGHKEGRHPSNSWM